jgi:hypothetical protein
MDFGPVSDPPRSAGPFFDHERCVRHPASFPVCYNFTHMSRESGIGREGAHEGLMEFLETQYISVTW